jgi:hypothetical protein
MKKVLALFIGFLVTYSAFADCTFNGLYVYPGGKTIKQNSIFIITGYGASQEVILGLNKKHDVFLKSGDTKIKLLVTETHVGQFYLTQALLKPETELVPGQDYQILIDNLPEYEQFGNFNSSTRKTEPYSYQVLALKDFEKPQISTRPKLIRKTFVEYGCGPEVYAIFSKPVTDTPDLIVKTTLKDLISKKKTTFYINPIGNELMVGHGMCAGEFNLEQGYNYEIEFSFMDSSGNLTNWKGKKISFTRPKVKGSGK